MYRPNLENVFIFDVYYLESRGYEPKGDEFYLPDEGYLLLADFSLVYDVTKIDDGTVNGDNDAQIIAINELLKYFAFQEMNWYKVSALVDRVSDNSGALNFISSTRRIIIPPPVSLSDCARKLFGVGTRYMPEWAQYNDDIALCLKAYAAYYGSGVTPPESPIDEDGNIVEPKDILPLFSASSCFKWFDKQFTLAIGDWRSANTSGWYKSNGYPVVSLNGIVSTDNTDVRCYMHHNSQTKLVLGSNTALIDVVLSPEELEYFGLTAPDRFYVIHFDKTRSLGPITMEIDPETNSYYDAWGWYYYYITTNELDNLVSNISKAVNWNLVILPMLVIDPDPLTYGRVSCGRINCDHAQSEYLSVVYLALHDHNALIELGASSYDVQQLINLIPVLEQAYIQKMYNEYKDKIVYEDTISDWDKMWMAYFGFRFYVPPPPPPPPPPLQETLEKQVNENRAIRYKEPLVSMGSGIGVKGHFAYVSYVDSPSESLYNNNYPNIYITDVFYGVKSISDVAFWQIDGVWTFLEGQNEVIINGWRWNGVYLWQSRHLLLIHNAVVRLKGMWVYCDEAFYKLFNYFQDRSTITQYRVFTGFYGSDIQLLRTRAYLDEHKRMVVTNQKRFAFVDVTSFSSFGSMSGILFANIRLLKLSANDAFTGVDS